MERIWHTPEEQSEPGRYLLLKTNHGNYVGHTDESGEVSFDESIHFNGPITIPAVWVKSWKYITEEEWYDLRRLAAPTKNENTKK